MSVHELSSLSVDDEVPLFGGGRASRRRRRRRILAVAASATAMILLAAGVFVATQRTATTTVAFDAALEDFRVEKATRDVPSAQNQETAIAAAETATADVPSPDEVAVSASEVAGPRPYTLPAEGVYAYRARGGESVSMLGASHTYPEQVFATVRHLGGCRWEHRIDVIQEHVDIVHLCSESDILSELKQERQVTFFGKRDGGELFCEPPVGLHRSGDAPGSTRSGGCSDGRGGDSQLLVTFVGTEDIDIDGTVVRAVVIEIEGTTTGRVEGTSFDRMWIHPENGMMLRWDRKVDSLATAFGAKVRYREDAGFTLLSLQPRT